MREYVSILNGLPIMYLIVVVAMVVVIGAMSMDAAFGWRKAKLRGEARTSYLFSRSITKFALAGVVKEWCDDNTEGNNWDWYDFAASAIGVAVVAVFIILLHFGKG